MPACTAGAIQRSGARPPRWRRGHDGAAAMAPPARWRRRDGAAATMAPRLFCKSHVLAPRFANLFEHLFRTFGVCHYLLGHVSGTALCVGMFFIAGFCGHVVCPCCCLGRGRIYRSTHARRVFLSRISCGPGIVVDAVAHMAMEAQGRPFRASRKGGRP